jgi:hypothetical protein
MLRNRLEMTGTSPVMTVARPVFPLLFGPCWRPVKARECHGGVAQPLDGGSAAWPSVMLRQRPGQDKAGQELLRLLLSSFVEIA